jgi:endonuclease-3
VGQILDEFLAEPPIPLHHRDPYTLLVAVLLSAQTTDARVNTVTPALFDLADTPASMAQIEVPRILAAIRTCGLAPTKAKNIQKLSRMLVEQHDGVVPADLKALEKLPGVGHKTASVVMSQAFGVPAFPVDTHIYRCARRWDLSRGKNVKQVEADLKKVFRRDTWSRRHLQIIYFGRSHCPARSHSPQDCPICSWANPAGKRG